jgi:hypothetical protein
MTDTELRELDARVHREVFGRKSQPPVYAPHLGRGVVPGLPWREPHKPYDSVPLYSTDIAAAWLVVEELIRRECSVEIGWLAASGFYCYVREWWYARGNAPSAPLAICSAAIEAVAPAKGRK